MSAETSPNERLGRFVETPLAGEIVRASVPPALLPLPPIDMLTSLELLSQAERALGRLDGITVGLGQHAEHGARVNVLGHSWRRTATVPAWRGRVTSGQVEGREDIHQPLQMPAFDHEAKTETRA